MKVLVTGASGFLGGRLVDRLRKDGTHDVSILVRRTSNLADLGGTEDLTVVLGDLSDASALEEATRGVDVVFHSAARVDDRGTRSQFVADNVTATEELLRVSQANGVGRFVFISSPSALMERDGGDQINIDESVPYPVHFLNLYSETKAAAEQAVLAVNSSAMTTCALRPRAIWGPGDRSGPIVRLLGRTEAGTLPDLSGGRHVYASLCHVDNIVEACLLAARSDNVGGKPYFIADDEHTDVWPFLGEVAEGFGFASATRTPNMRVVGAAVSAIEQIWKIPYVARRWSPPLSRYVLALMSRSATFDTNAARNDFGYTPVIDRDSGLTGFVEWVQSEGGISALTQPRKI